jgi:hypothetical protein
MGNKTLTVVSPDLKKVDIEYIKLRKAEVKAAKKREDIATITSTVKSILENPIIELIGGFGVCEYLRNLHHEETETTTIGLASWLRALLGINPTLSTTTKKVDVPYFRQSALNWAEAGIILAVVAQQMKDNPNAQLLASGAITTAGRLGEAAIGTVGNVLKGGISALGGTAMLAGL